MPISTCLSSIISTCLVSIHLSMYPSSFCYVPFNIDTYIMRKVIIV